MKNIITLIIIQISLAAMGQDIMTPEGYERINQNCHIEINFCKQRSRNVAEVDCISYLNSIDNWLIHRLKGSDLPKR